MFCGAMEGEVHALEQDPKEYLMSLKDGKGS